VTLATVLDITMNLGFGEHWTTNEHTCSL